MTFADGAHVPVEIEMTPAYAYPIYVAPSLNQITLHWKNVARAIADNPTFTVLRGTSPSSLGVLKTGVASSGGIATGSYVDTTVKAGVNYYYALRYGAFLQTTAPVAAQAWPRYTYGAYHGFPAPARLVSGVTLTGGHAYTFSVYGKWGIPTGNIQSVALNLDVVSPSSNANVWIQKGGSTKATFWNAFIQKGVESTTFSIVPVGSGGTITIYLSSGTAKINVDASGYFALATLDNEGPGSQFYADAYPEQVANTTRIDGLLPHGYTLNVFARPYAVPASQSTDVSAVMVEITAYEAAKNGTLTAFAYHGANHGTTTIAYRFNTTSTIAIVPVTNVVIGSYRYPAISILNNGPTGTEVVVSTIGFFDQYDDVYGGARYVPIAPKHVYQATMAPKLSKIIAPGSPTSLYTSGLVTTMSSSPAGYPTGVRVSAVGGGPAPIEGQFHSLKGQSVASTTMLPLGFPDNEIDVLNGAATTPLNMWANGMFNWWTQPSWPSYTDGGTPGGPVATVANGKPLTTRPATAPTWQFVKAG